MSSLPTLRQSWSIDDNNRSCDAGVDTLSECFQKTLFTIKDILVNLPEPWIVIRSSNGVTSTDDDGYADQWSSSTDLVWSAGNHSWIVLQHPIWDFQICLDLDSATGSGREMSCFASHGGLFFGGSISARPIAQDEVFVFENEDWIGNNIAAFDAWVHAWQSSDGIHNKLLVTTSEGQGEGMFWSFDQVPTSSDLWEYNRVAMIVTHRDVAGGACLDLGRMMVTDTNSSFIAGLLAGDNPIALLTAPQKEPSNDFSKKCTRFNKPGFNQNEYLDIGNVSELNFAHTDAFSFSFWVRVINRATGVYTVLSKRSTSGGLTGYGIFVNGSNDPNGLGLIQVQMINSFGGGNFLRFTSSDRVDDGNWHHVAWTYDGSTNVSGNNIYIDGVSSNLLIDTDNLSSTLANASDFQIGALNAVGEMVGSIDDVSVFNKELSSSEVLTIYNSGVPFDLRTDSLNSNLIGYWLMGDGDTDPIVKDRSNSTPILASGSVLDRSISRNNGTPTNMEDADFNSDVPGGVSGYSALFDGTNEYVSIGDVSELKFDVGDAFSISAWVKFTSSGSQQAIVSKRSSAASSVGYSLEVASTGEIFAQIIDDVTIPQRVSIGTTSTTWNDGSWHHILMTKGTAENASDLDLFIDGLDVTTTVLEDTFVSGSGTSFDTTTGFQISGHAGTNLVWDGRIDEVAVFNKKLNIGDAQSIYNSGAPIDITLQGSLYPYLVGYWGMGELHNDATMNGGLTQTGLIGDTPSNPLLFLRLGSQNAEVDVFTRDMLTERASLEVPNELGGFIFPVVPDDSPSGNNGTATNMDFNDISGDTAGGDSIRSLDFDGSNDHIVIGDVTELKFDIGDPFSISCWFKTTVAGTTRILVDKLDSSAPNTGYDIGLLSSGALIFDIIESNNTSELRIDTVATGFNDGAWHHVVATYDGSTDANNMHFYVDGVDEAVSVVTNNLSGSFDTTTPFQIGARDGTNIPYSGKIDEVAVFSKELTSLEVEALYNSGSPIDVTENQDGYFDGYLAGYWRLGENLGNTSFPMIPIPLVSSYGYRGLHGFLTDMYWGTEALDPNPGSTYPDNPNNRQFAQFKHVILPWTGDASEPYFGIDEVRPYATFDGYFTGGGDIVSGVAIIEYFQMTGIDTGAPSQPSYHSWVVTDSPDPTGALAVGSDAPPFGGPLTNIIVSAQWSE